MTRPPGPPSFLGAVNPLLAQVPVRLETGTVDLPGGAGKVAVLQVQTASTTMHVILGAEDLGNWVKVISDLHASLSGRSLAVPTIAERITLGNGGPVTPGRLG